MDKSASSLNDVIKALPRVQNAVREEIGSRIEAGEAVAGQGTKADSKKRGKSAA
jgi:hypothetical protein